MFGQKVWRPVAVAVVVSAAGFLPQGVAVAAMLVAVALVVAAADGLHRTVETRVARTVRRLLTGLWRRRAGSRTADA